MMQKGTREYFMARLRGLARVVGQSDGIEVVGNGGRDGAASLYMACEGQAFTFNLQHQPDGTTTVRIDLVPHRAPDGTYEGVREWVLQGQFGPQSRSYKVNAVNRP